MSRKLYLLLVSCMMLVVIAIMAVPAIANASKGKQGVTQKVVLGKTCDGVDDDCDGLASAPMR